MVATHNQSLSVPNATVAAPLVSTFWNVNNIAYGWVLPVICLAGIIGNIANLMTLASPRLRTVSYMYLKALAVADLACMICVMVFCVDHRFGFEWDGYLVVFYKTHLMLTLINYFITAGILVVVVLTIERYISVCFPIFFRNWNSPSRATMAILVAYLVPLSFYIPYGILRHKMVEKTEGHWTRNDSDYYNNRGYKIYELTREALLKLFPILILMVLNLQIIIAFRKRTKMRETMRRPMASMTSKSSKSSKESGEKNTRDEALLYLLAGIVLMFFICNIPAAINLILINEHIKTNPYYRVFRAVANLLEITNHALNFYLFCLCSGDYRSTFLEKFPLVHKTYKHSIMLRDYGRKKLGMAPHPSPPTNRTIASSHTMDETESSSELVTLKSGATNKTADVSYDTTLSETPQHKAREPNEDDALLGTNSNYTISTKNGDIKFITDSENEDEDMIL